MDSAYRKLLPNPRQSASWLSILFFGWTIPMFKQSYQDESLDSNDAFGPIESDQSDRLGDRLEKNWKDELKLQSNPSLLRSLFKTFWCQFLLIGLIQFTYECVFRLSYPLFLKGFLSYFRENSEISRDEAIKYGMGLAFSTACSGFATVQYFFNKYHFGMRLRIAVSSLIYRKSLRLSQSALNKTSSAKVINLLSNDVQRFESFNVHSLWISPITTIIGTYILWSEIRWAAIIGIATFCIFILVQSYTGKLLTKIRYETALRTDERVRFMDEIVSGIQVIKKWSKHSDSKNTIICI